MPIALIPRLARVLVAGSMLALGACAPIGQEASPVTSDAPLTSDAPPITAAPVTGGEPRPAVPPAPSSPVVAGGLGAGVVAEAVGRLSIVAGRAIVPGQRVLVIAGPIDHAGAPSFQVQHWGDLEHGLRPDSDIGWVRADIAAEMLRPVPVVCPDGTPSIREIAGLQVFERPICFGDRLLTMGPLTASDFRVGTRTSGRWLSDDGRPDFFTGLPITAAHPGLEIPDGSWVTVTGRFADPSSAACGDAVDVELCRQRFVVLEVGAANAPPTVLRGTWRRMPRAPIGGRMGHTMTWTGSEVLVWGGTESTRDQPLSERVQQPAGGAAWRQDANAWRVIPGAPIAGRDSALSAWSGRELLVWGGWSGALAKLDGAAYDPVADTWRRLPAAPLAGSGAVGGWVAGRLIVVTSEAAAAYDPAADAWTELAAAPVHPDWRAAVVAAGRLVVIAWGDGAADLPQAAVLDPGTGAWTTVRVPLPPVAAGAVSAATGDEVVLPGAGVALDPVTGRWRATAPCERLDGGAWTGRLLVGAFAAFDPAQDRCLDVPPPPMRDAPFDGTNGREFPVGAWTGSRYVTWSGGTGGDIVWVPADGAVFTPAGGG